MSDQGQDPAQPVSDQPKVEEAQAPREEVASFDCTIFGSSGEMLLSDTGFAWIAEPADGA